MVNIYHIIAITGKSASGKDSIARVLSYLCGYKIVVSTTTRPKRSNETNHVEYHFVSDEEFQKLINNNQLIEYRVYHTIENDKPAIWHYGITKDEIDLNKFSYICVVDLKGLSDLKKYFPGKIISFFINVKDEDRKLRAIARDRNFELAEWDRRAEDDKRIFKDVEKVVDYIIDNNNFSECIKSILAYLK